MKQEEISVSNEEFKLTHEHVMQSVEETREILMTAIIDRCRYIACNTGNNDNEHVMEIKLPRPVQITIYPEISLGGGFMYNVHRMMKCMTTTVVNEISFLRYEVDEKTQSGFFLTLDGDSSCMVHTKDVSIGSLTELYMMLNETSDKIFSELLDEDMNYSVL